MEVNPNSQQPTGSSVAPNALGHIQRPGEYLRQIRLSQQRDIKDVAGDLKMPVKTLEALEQDEYTALPEATFIKGYYRTYAKYLKADASAIISRFDEIYQNETGMAASHGLNNSPIKIMGKLPGSKSARNRKLIKRVIIGLVLLGIIWVIIAALQQRAGKDKAEDDQDSSVQVLTLENGSGTTSSAQVGVDSMSLSFSRPTSVHIVDSTGKVLATGRQSAALTLNGESPFQIRLDDAQAVSLSLNNESISLSPYTVNGKAEFRLSR